ncbi:ArsR/SmtB family transcription factor [Flavobacterium aquiphilum]|uniref:ArsR/SmtB family transcription factor n=1 Tax=Flavobacterium aquiphilum TaxID=3003261 RepID=UPI0024814B69|nr:metalloregulator ArsR/SmtB family transcription factor [Flavobacterium aquiphilum]
MGTTKRQYFDQETNAIAEICKALGHPTRMQIMTLLWKENNRTCGEIVAQIPLAQSTISKHLSELKKAELLNIKNEGKKTIYSIEVHKIQVLKKYFSNYLSNKTDLNEKESMVPDSVSKKKKENNNLKQFNYQFPDKKTKAD